VPEPIVLLFPLIYHREPAAVMASLANTDYTAIKTDFVLPSLVPVDLVSPIQIVFWEQHAKDLLEAFNVSPTQIQANLATTTCQLLLPIAEPEAALQAFVLMEMLEIPAFSLPIAFPV